MRIEFSPPDMSQMEIDEVVDSLRAGWITTGPKTKKFERELAKWCGLPSGDPDAKPPVPPNCACLSSATAAMELCLRLLGIGPGDEVITAAYTYSASAAVIEHVGAKIVLIDTLPGSFEIDYGAVARAINPRTKAVIPVDVAGAMCDYARLLEVVESKSALFSPSPDSDLQRALGRVAVLADAAHSFGSSVNGVPSGAWADFSAFSFHAVKNLTTAEGGALVWKPLPGVDDKDIYRRLMLLSLHGQSKDALEKMNNPGSWEYDIEFPGYKCNMPDIQAALGLAQLRRFKDLIARRGEIVKIYDSMLEGHDLTILKHHRSGFDSNMHLYLARVDGADEPTRNRIIKLMAEAGVAANVHFKPLPLMTAYKNLGFDIGNFPNAYAQYQNVVTLPLHTKLTDEDARFVAQSFLSAIETARARRADGQGE